MCVDVMRDYNLKLEDLEVSHTLHYITRNEEINIHRGIEDPRWSQGRR
jgi:hypothetical protein